MAVTNQQVLAAVEELNTKLEALALTANTAAERAEVAAGLKHHINDLVGRTQGDRTEVINRLDDLSRRVYDMDRLVAGYVSQPRATSKTWRQRWDEFMATLMGSPAKS